MLTSSTGGGHDARAEAFAEWCFQLYRHEVEVRIEQMLEDSSVVQRAGVRLYNRIQQGAPWVHKVFYAIVEVLAFLNTRRVTFGERYYVDVLQRFRPHLIFSVHDCLNRGYFQVARKVLGREHVRCATYCGEFSGGWGYSRNWIEPTVDRYFSRTATANDFAVKRGIPVERSRVRALLMYPRSHVDIFDAGERRAFLTKKLGLRTDRLTVFLATGGNGAHNHFDLLPALVRHADRIQAIVICGRNRQAYNELLQWRAQHPAFGCYLEGYSEIVHRLMQVSDVIVTRGGTTTCAKALFYRCPIVFNAFGGIMPQEALTWKFFRNGAECPKVENAADFAALIDRWMAQPEELRALRERFLQLRHEEDPTVLIDELVELGNEVARAQLERHPFPSEDGPPNTRMNPEQPGV